MTDNQTGDASNAAGTIQVLNAQVGSYTITEFSPPAGYVADSTPRTAVVGDPQLDPNATANPVVSSAFRDPTVPSITAVKSSVPASGTVANPAAVTLGQTISYTIAVTNSGSTQATGVVVTDAIPTGTTYVPGSADNNGTLSNGSLSWTINVPGASTVNLDFQVTVNANDANGTLIDNHAVFSNVNTPNCVAVGANTCSTNTTHHEVEFPVIGAVKSSNPTSGTVANPAPVTPGQTITYTVAVTNTGLQDAAAVVVTDAIPAGTTYVPGSADHGGTLTNGTLSWTVPVAHGATVNLQFQVTVNAGDANGTLIDNTATVNGVSTNTTHHEVEFPVINAVKSSNPTQRHGGQPGTGNARPDDHLHGGGFEHGAAGCGRGDRDRRDPGRDDLCPWFGGSRRNVEQRHLVVDRAGRARRDGEPAVPGDRQRRRRQRHADRQHRAFQQHPHAELCRGRREHLQHQHDAP